MGDVLLIESLNKHWNLAWGSRSERAWTGAGPIVALLSHSWALGCWASHIASPGFSSSCGKCPPTGCLSERDEIICVIRQACVWLQLTEN